jgi:hypothetical protein
MNSPKAQHYLLVLRLRDRFLIHIIVKHVAEQSMTVRRNHEKTLATARAPLFSFLTADRPWNPEKRRDGVNIGWFA